MLVLIPPIIPFGSDCLYFFPLFPGALLTEDSEGLEEISPGWLASTPSLWSALFGNSWTHICLSAVEAPSPPLGSATVDHWLPFCWLRVGRRSADTWSLLSGNWRFESHVWKSGSFLHTTTQPAPTLQHERPPRAVMKGRHKELRREANYIFPSFFKKNIPNTLLRLRAEEFVLKSMAFYFAGEARQRLYLFNFYSLFFIIYLFRRRLIINKEYEEIGCFIIKLSRFPARLLLHCFKIAPANSIYFKMKVVLFVTRHCNN